MSIYFPLRLTRRDLVYLGVEDRREQDTLLTAASLLHTSVPAAPLTRMDSGYYDGHSESTTSEGSSSTTSALQLTRYSSLDSIGRITDMPPRPPRKELKGGQGLNLQYFDSVSKHRSGGGERRTSLSESLFSLAAQPDRHLNKSF